jgi:hypothetical protein
MRLIPIALLTGFLSAAPVLANESPSPDCLMRPDAWSIALADSGFAWRAGGDINGTCGDIQQDEWIRMTSGARDLCVHLDGPEGSGRYWKVVVGTSAKQQSRPVRGTCMATSTVGWRTL